MLSLDRIQTALADQPGQFQSGASKRASVAMVLRDNLDTEALDVFFIRRARDENDPWSGHMAFPGGRHEPDDDSLEHTARRETHEETGLLVVPEQCIGRLDDIQGRSRGRSVDLVISCYIFALAPGRDPAVTLNYEVDATFWIPLNTIADATNHRRYTPPQPHAGQYPGVAIATDNSDVVWGLTYRFLCDFFQRLDIALPAVAADIDPQAIAP